MSKEDDFIKLDGLVNVYILKVKDQPRRSVLTE